MGKLTNPQVKNSKFEGKIQKMFDGEGLYLLINKSGKYWRYKYRFNKKEKNLALGVYPQISLKEARSKHQDARDLLLEGADPGQVKKAQKDINFQTSCDTFGALTKEWLTKQPWSEKHRKSQLSRINGHILPSLGDRPVREITAKEILTVCRRIEARGIFGTAHRVKTICSQVFKYGIAKGDVDSDPCRDLSNALTPHVVKNMATLTAPSDIGGLMRAIDGYRGYVATWAALRLSPLVFLRPGELRHAEWSEFDLDEAMWRIPAEKMKMKRLHMVPLSRQALSIIKEMVPVSGHRRYVFPAITAKNKPMCDNTINSAIRRMGYTKDELCAHGLRAMASTSLHEAGWDTNIVETQMAHKDPNQVRGSYNHAEYLPQRIKMMQFWADYLDKLKSQTP